MCHLSSTESLGLEVRLFITLFCVSVAFSLIINHPAAIRYYRRFVAFESRGTCPSSAHSTKDGSLFCLFVEGYPFEHLPRLHRKSEFASEWPERTRLQRVQGLWHFPHWQPSREPFSDGWMVASSGPRQERYCSNLLEHSSNVYVVLFRMATWITAVSLHDGSRYPSWTALHTRKDSAAKPSRNT